MEKIKRLSTKEQVLQSLRRSIFNGTLKHGQEITQEEIADLLGVSRMPVREAFQVLDREGLIHIQSNRRVVVIGLTKEDVEDHYDIRAFLEGMAAEKACDHPEFFDELKQIHQKINASDGANYVQLNEELHRLIWKASNSPRLYSLLSDLWNGLQPQFPDFVSFQTSKSAGEHEQLVKAILEQNKAAARNHASNHVLRTKKDFLTTIHLPKG
ncbi:GntR family transcriptional regulator [Lentibacillus sp. N15]|uniref:GntR family transcriptional regulator n=1 Tax=Lentibacillus songyuanensis TaxID=3136161 RepID=UPI0031BB9558